MDLRKIERTELKILIKEILKEDTTLLKEVIRELFNESQVVPLSNPIERRKKIEQMIERDFDEFDDVFKALA